jgi:hypothetical protein
VLEAIYEQDFLPCSYGFRPARSAHHAYSGDPDHPIRWIVITDSGDPDHAARPGRGVPGEQPGMVFGRHH